MGLYHNCIIFGILQHHCIIFIIVSPLEISRDPINMMYISHKHTAHCLDLFPILFHLIISLTSPWQRRVTLLVCHIRACATIRFIYSLVMACFARQLVMIFKLRLAGEYCFASETAIAGEWCLASKCCYANVFVQLRVNCFV